MKTNSQSKKPEGFWRIEQLNEQLGKGLRGTLVYIGASKVGYRCRDDDGIPSIEPKFNEHTGCVDFEIGLRIKPNFGEKQILFWIALNRRDYYTLWATRGRKIVKEFKDLSCENIAEVVEETYDEIIKKDFGGFIPI